LGTDPIKKKVAKAGTNLIAKKTMLGVQETTQTSRDKKTLERKGKWMEYGEQRKDTFESWDTSEVGGGEKE